MKNFPLGKTFSGKVTRVLNRKRHFNADKCYVHLCVRGHDYLFTDSDMKTAGDRALHQPEDLRSRNLFQRLFIDIWK